MVKFIRSHCFVWLVPKLRIPLAVYLLTGQSFCSSRTCRNFGSKPSDRLRADANPRSEYDQRISSVLKSRGLVVCRLWVITHLPTFPWRLLPFRYLIKYSKAVPISFQCMKLGHIYLGNLRISHIYFTGRNIFRYRCKVQINYISLTKWSFSSHSQSPLKHVF